MVGDREGELIAYARSLENRDATLAGLIEDATGLLHRVDGVRAEGGRVQRSLVALPEEIDRAKQAIADAKLREAEARREVSNAERALEETLSSKRASEDTRTSAERAFRRASVLADDAVEGVARQEERLRLLLSDQVALRAAAEGLIVEAGAVARDVVALPRLSESGRSTPGNSLEEIETWGARAHSAIFVVRGGLEGEREQLVHEANVLAAARLGEQGGAASVTLVRQRLERELG